MTGTGEALKQIREAAGLSRKELADSAGISRDLLNKIEQGARRLSPRTLTRLAAALELSPNDLAAKIAVLEANAAATHDDMQRSLLRVAAIGGGVVASSLLRPLVAAAGRTALQAAPRLGPAGALGALAAAAVMAARRRQQERSRSTPTHEELDVEEVRRQLIEKIQDMSDEALLTLIAQVESQETDITPGPSA
ncbi:helix-turn-helix transcriptional regulator [Streptomyces sp. NPDC048045]|uniref:helix-turn-helix domain-containing protein n=1 Tax=Streptomyces sp. NPDC048045 TaxID=3154710 RepID=UPI00341A59CA